MQTTREQDTQTQTFAFKDDILIYKILTLLWISASSPGEKNNKYNADNQRQDSEGNNNPHICRW